MRWGQDEAGNPVPEMILATGYEWIDPVTLQIKLRDGVKFSNGEPFNAESAKLSMELMFSAYHYSQWLANTLKEVQIVDPLTINIVLAKEMPWLPSVLLMGSYQIAPKDYQTRGKEAFDQAPVCSGPWIFKEHVRDDHVSMTANPDYWGGTPEFKEIIFRIIPDDNSRLAALEAGELGLALNVPLSAADRIEANPDLLLYSVPGLRLYAVYFESRNEKAKPLEDVRVRLALNYAIDRAGMCKTVFGGRCTPFDGQPLSRNHIGYNPNLQTYPYDPAAAKRLLTEAGYPKGFDLDYTYTSGRYPQDKQAGETIASYLRAIGLTVHEVAVDYTSWAQAFDARKMTALYTVGFGFGRDGYLAMLSYGPGVRYRTFENMPGAFDNALANAGEATTDEARAGFMQDAMAAVHIEPHAVFLYSLDDVYATRSWLTDFTPTVDQTLRVVDWGVIPK
jgi:peptide/nickel transport system substrate-binding protein